MNFQKFFNDRGLRTGSLGSLSVKVVGAVLVLAISISLANILGAEGYGTYVLAFSTIMLLSIPLTLGLPVLIVRYIPQYEVEENYGAMRGLLKRSQQFVILSYLLLLLLTAIFFLLFRDSFSLIFIKTFAYGMLLLLFMGLNAIRCAVLEGMRYVVLGQIPDIILRNVLLLIGVLLGAVFFDLQPDDVMLVHVVAAAIGYLIGLYFLQQKKKKHLKNAVAVYHNRKWFYESLQFSFNMGVNNIKTRISIYILAAMEGTAAVAFFEVAIKAANLVAFALTALNKSLAPHISKAFQEDNKERLQSILRKASKFMFLISLPVTFVFVVAGQWMLKKFYGVEFSSAYIPLVIICIAQLINAFSGSVGLFLLMTNEQRFVLRVNILNTVANIIIAIVLVHLYSLTGAALAYALLLVVQNIIFVFYTKRKFNINTLAI